MHGAEETVRLNRARFDGAIFDLDGVLTRTARVHAAAWKAMFDEFLQRRVRARGADLSAFDAEADYSEYVDGKPRYAGVQSFLRARGIELPYGEPGDEPGAETVCGLGNRKNMLFRKMLEERGVQVYGPAVDLVRRLRATGLKTAVVSSSKNCRLVLEAAAIAELFDVRVDGRNLEARGLRGKPQPDMYLEAARRLGVAPERAAVFEDALAGVEAGARGGFGCVVGVDRGGRFEALRRHGARHVVTDLGVVTIEEAEA
ncbi:MAG: beta-phosphoglucomutase family hydrolase [Gammaproteobacteria bacterium]|nr:beta-phosphoglucomutase family hydrolase [Gammaproteobacteria bacterium]NIR30346.1 beta-phosphoglucomutase family hydrolase [Gammaproteobacteria bacterium]NIR98190.1 beta-phosphoglucomutase family hydrolase [Gammaproteobacteria bacterium]NIT63857.1 beta-phosphoglucomutase family hydrolase [Gammaproteobacteria bacterium]NIV20861.1 beta-phosphoglucomutase family hydrolase [Gammaproteobacteria bacterium]